jgi:membrane protease YdiL (CAAX protease family)
MERASASRRGAGRPACGKIAGSALGLRAGLLGGLVAGLIAWSAPAHAFNPELAAAASLILPGLGQAANGDLPEAGAHLGLSLVLAKQYLVLIDQPDYVAPGDRTDSDQRLIHINHTSYEADFYSTALLDLTLYSSFAAYRDARLARNNEGYRTPPPQESATDLALAPFKWEYLARWTTLLPLAVALYNAAAPPSNADYLYSPDRTISRNDIAYGSFFQYGMVAVGEESFFRGVLNNSFSNAWGPWWGLAGSSVLFGAAHEGAPGQATSYGAAAFGAYLGYLQQQDGYRIGQDVAIHFWWDFLTSLAMLQKRSGQQQVTLASIDLRW